MSRFVQIEKRAPAPLIGVPSLKCSQSQVMPQMPFLQAAIPRPFRPTDQMGSADHAIGLQSVLGGNRAKHLAGSLDELNAGNS